MFTKAAALPEELTEIGPLKRIHFGEKKTFPSDSQGSKTKYPSQSAKAFQGSLFWYN